MFDKERFNFALENYKKDFPTWWQKEKHKWEAVKCFQDNWNIDAADFFDMLTKSLQKLNQNLIYGFAKDVIKNIFAKNEPEKVREMFRELYDENIDFDERISNFEKNSEELNAKYGRYNLHHQTYNTISAYLWLRYPDKYYIYSPGKIKALLDFLDVDKSGYGKDFFNKFYNEICEELKKDTELVDLLKKNLTDKCYSDSELKTLTVDFGFYVHKNYDDFASAFQSSSVAINLPINNSYTKTDFLSEVFISEKKYKRLVSILNYKKNIILQGAPGVGKTFAAKKLAYSILGAEDDSKIEFVQFHQNYSYEDFVIGWRPTATNFELQTGIFYNFCKKAETEPDKKFFFIIDEINRGNLSKIFGELLMLIESDKRGKEKVKIPANGENFSVPENLYIIGMMNTADRSLALIDYALRRRFSFIEFEPAFDSEGFKTYQSDLQNKTFDNLITQIKNLNAEISADKTLGKGFCIGHSYFCNFDGDEENLKTVVECEILPTLEEYFFDSEEKFQDWSEKLRGVFK